MTRRPCSGRISTQMDRVNGIQTGPPPASPSGSISNKTVPPKSCQPVTVPARAPELRSKTAQPVRSDR